MANLFFKSGTAMVADGQLAGYRVVRTPPCTILHLYLVQGGMMTITYIRDRPEDDADLEADMIALELNAKRKEDCDGQV